MPWIKVEDAMVDHPKIAPLSDAAFRWALRGLSYANRFLTNGRLPDAFVDTVPVGVLAELTTPTCGQKYPVWDRTPTGRINIHDYRKYQSSKATVERAQQLNKVRQSKWRDEKRNGVTEASRNGVTEASPQRSRNAARSRSRSRSRNTLPLSPLSEEKLAALDKWDAAVEEQKAAAKARETQIVDALTAFGETSDRARDAVLDLVEKKLTPQ